MLSYQPTKEIGTSAKMTYFNMRPYYEHFAVNWDCSMIEEQIRNLINIDILLNGKLVGVVRLTFDNKDCYIRDFQVSRHYQNKGIGTLALAECEKLAKKAGAHRMRLRVFKISPAFHLYQRVGFVVEETDERFYHMSRAMT